MKKFGRLRILIMLGALPLLSGITDLRAQTDMYYNSALTFLQSGQVDSARKCVDMLLEQPGAKTDPDNWYLYGVVYKEMYKHFEASDVQSNYRNISFDAFKKSLQLDTVSARMKITRDNVRFLAGKYYNDAVITLDTVRFTTSINCYNSYREAALIADPGTDMKKKDIEFDLALASTYGTIYNNNKKKNVKFFDLTRDTYMKVLELDPDNYTANYNLGLLYWNKGVDLMYDIDYDANLDSVFKVEDHSVDLFKQSLPFAEKAYEIEPKREETLIVLSGIYYSLNEFEKSKLYQQTLDDLRKQH